MATRSRSAYAKYADLNTVPAVMGIVFAVTAAVQFLGATISFTTPVYTFDPTHALVLGLVVLIVAFASSDTKDWRHYETWEQGAVALAVLLMVGNEYLVEIQDILTQNSPHAAYIAFVVSMMAWGILSR